MDLYNGLKIIKKVIKTENQENYLNTLNSSHFL